MRHAEMDETNDKDKRIQELEQENAALRSEVRSLLNEVTKLRKELDEWKRGFRVRKRRFSSRPERKPDHERKRPGRKKGHAGAGRKAPDHVDRTEHRVMDLCPDCRVMMNDTEEEEVVLVEDIIPAHVEVVRYVLHTSECPCCHRIVKAKLPAELGRQPKTGMGVQALAVSLRSEYKMTWEAISRYFETHAGMHITPSGVAQMVARLAERSKPGVAEIEAEIRSSPFAHLDETGWPEDGFGRWGWVAATPKATRFLIAPTRSRAEVDALLGGSYKGHVVSDFLKVYTEDDTRLHQLCWAHLIREAKSVAELDPKPTTVEFRDHLVTIYRSALPAQATQDAGMKHGIRVALGRLAADKHFGRHPEVARLQRRIDLEFHGLLAFLDIPGLPADNNHAEREIRSLVLTRKISGGTRSPRGSATVSTWASICRTLKKQDIPLAPYLSQMQASYHLGTPPPSVFARN